jgi:fatty-acyl-CoA synthase
MDDIWTSTIDGLVRRAAARTPQRVAVRFADRTWTYAELDDGVSRVASALLRRGLSAGDRVAALGHNSDAFLLGFLGCSRAGLVHVPINTHLVGDELAYPLVQSGAVAVLVDPTLRGNLDAVLPRVPVSIVLPFSDDDGSVLDIAGSGPVPTVAPGVQDTDLAQLLYTSGTTSRPKAAMLTHRSLLHQYMSAIHALRFDPDDEPLHAMPLYHVAQLHTFLMPYLAIGATNHILASAAVDEVLCRVERSGVRSMFLAPTVWVAISGHPDFTSRDLGCLRKAYYGASIMPVPVVDRLRTRLPELEFFNCLGQSEAGPLTSVLLPEEHAARPESAGRPVLFVELRVVDDDGNDVPPGMMGEIVYRSPQLCAGYWNDPDATADAFRDGWFHSGDLARRDEQGYVFVVDRIKDVINTGGVIVASREVEDALYRHPAVAEAAVIGLPDPKWIETVTAVVVTRDVVTEAELIEHVRGHLAGFKTPKRVHFVDQLPRNGAGKLLKRQLRHELSAANAQSDDATADDVTEDIA